MGLKGLLSILLIIATVGAIAQTEETTLTQSLDQKGLRLISKTELSDVQISQILNYNFEEYRKADASLIIKVLNGPHLELFSKNRVATGKVDPVQDEETEEESTHTHTPPGEKKIKKFEIISLNVFEIPTDETN